MLRLTTNVTVSPASSARSSSAAWRMSSIASGRVSANSAVSSSSVRRSPSRPRAIAPATRSERIARASVRPGAAARDEAPVLRLDRRRARPARPTRGRCTAGRRTGARSARRRPAARRLRTWCGDGNGCSGEMWSPLALRPPRSVAPAATSSGHQSARFGGTWMPTPGISRARLGDEALHVLDRRPAWPTRAGRGAARRDEPGAPEALGRLGGDLGRLLAVVAAVRDEVLQDDLLQVAVLGVHGGQRLERGDRGRPRSRRCRRGSRS